MATFTDSRGGANEAHLYLPLEISAYRKLGRETAWVAMQGGTIRGGAGSIEHHW